MDAVHPHACGEYVTDGLDQLLLRRFTPTRVGNTSTGATSWRPMSVHPHACGEYLGLRRGIAHDARFTPTRVGNTSFDRSVAAGHLGSPPRVWGIRVEPCRTFCRLAVHPHACGEYVNDIPPDGETTGSPPRVWGIRVISILYGRHLRFTPTRVGNTSQGQQLGRRETVHPHACGEYAGWGEWRGGHRGSPPRVWGILAVLSVINHHSPVHPHACGEYGHRHMALHLPGRFTPTRVGNTEGYCRFAPEGAVHPHACGEYGRRAAVLQLPLRFTPTRVGNTGERRDVRRRGAVHPHACGEYDEAQVVGHNDGGSPPRVWGILGAVTLDRLGLRFTPTRVGNTTAASNYATA